MTSNASGSGQSTFALGASDRTASSTGAHSVASSTPTPVKTRARKEPTAEEILNGLLEQHAAGQLEADDWSAAGMELEDQFRALEQGLPNLPNDKNPGGFAPIAAEHPSERFVPTFGQHQSAITEPEEAQQVLSNAATAIMDMTPDPANNAAPLSPDSWVPIPALGSGRK